MKKTMIAIGVFGLGLVLALGVFLWLPKSEWSKSLRPDDERVVSLGERIYRSHCAECHGQNL